ncbi:hypothetical protein BH09PAT2_BH09PAT2_03530 [soil metagenome]
MDKKNILITVGSILAIGGFLFSAYIMTSKPVVTDYPDLNTLQANDPVKWSPAKTQLLIEYSDLQCPACQAFHALLTELEKDSLIKKNITFVYRHYPLDSLHPNARIAAQAAEAAGIQGKFFEMHDVLFNKQSEWSTSKSPPDFFKKYAVALKLDVAKFEKDYTSDAVKKRIQDDQVGGDKVGVQGTPTFYFNGKKLENPQSPEAFRTVLLSGIKN